MPWRQGLTYNGIQMYLYKISVCSIGQNVTKPILTLPPRIQFGKLFFLLKNLIFNTISNIILDLTSFGFVVFVVGRRLVLPNFEKLQQLFCSARVHTWEVTVPSANFDWLMLTLDTWVKEIRVRGGTASAHAWLGKVKDQVAGILQLIFSS